MKVNISLKGFEQKQVQRAVEALNEYVKKRETKELFDESEEPIYLQFGFKKIPHKENQVIKIPLPHPLWQNSEACIFVKDLDKKKRDYEETERHFKNLLMQKGLNNIAQVIPLMQLKKEYQPFEAKRNLSQLYDVFLGDECIIRLLPGFLGKAFYAKRKIPIAVNMKATDLKKEINTALEKTYCYIGGKGSCFQVQVARSSFKSDQMISNIVAVVNTIAESVPGGPSNIHTVNLRTADSPALPVYISFESASEVVLPSSKERIKHDKPEDVTPVEDAKVYVTKDKRIMFVNPDQVKKKRQRGKKGKKGKDTNEKSDVVGRKRKNPDDSINEEDKEIPKKKKRHEANNEGTQVLTKKQQKDNDKSPKTPKEKKVLIKSENKGSSVKKTLKTADKNKVKLSSKQETLKSEKKVKTKGAKKPKAKSFVSK